jgi:hypothetical protein
MRTVKDGLAGEWLRDYGPDLGETVPVEFNLWRVSALVQLWTPGSEDAIVWNWSNDGVFSGKSVHSTFVGKVKEPTVTQIGVPN